MSQDQAEYITARKRAYALTGHTNLEEAFTYFEQERDGMQELKDLNEAQNIVIQRSARMVSIVIEIANLAQEEGAMFSDKLRKLIQKFNAEQIELEDRLHEAMKLWKR